MTASGMSPAGVSASGVRARGVMTITSAAQGRERSLAAGLMRQGGAS